MQGAGGMIMPDPAFQRAMVRVCRRRGIPVIFDEVFSGLWRLGTASAAEQLGVRPDIACFAKLLTGMSIVNITPSFMRRATGHEPVHQTPDGAS